MFGTSKIKAFVLGGIAGGFTAALAAPIILSAGFAPAEMDLMQTQPGADLAADDALAVPGLANLPTSLTELVADVASDDPVELVEEEHCLSQAVYFEARSEALEGQLAVAQVVLNRVQDRRYPDTICGVVFQGEHRRHACQFSFACDGLPDRPRNAQAWTIAKSISHIALNDYWNDVTSLSTHYHADYVSPYWEDLLDEQVQVGRHIFYRDNSF